MIIVKFHGYLANIMFEYALGLYLAKKNSATLKFDLTEYTEPWYKAKNLKDCRYALEPFGIDICGHTATAKEIATFKRYEKRTGWQYIIQNNLFADETKYIKQNGLLFEPRVLNAGDGSFLDGYWQCEKYFPDMREELSTVFSLKHPPSGRNEEFANLINASNAVCLHVRRGDYASSPKYSGVHGTMAEAYYRGARAYMHVRISDMRLFVFSDDIPWARENLGLPADTIYIEGNNETPHEDLRLMSLCKHFIIANSTFSWWGAWLSRNENPIVIAPALWFRDPRFDSADIVPERWIKR